VMLFLYHSVAVWLVAFSVGVDSVLCLIENLAVGFVSSNISILGKH
jgi:hypothetical protein